MYQNSGRWSWSSWGCAQATIVTLTILLVSYPVAIAMDNGIDLLEALNLQVNYSQYDGINLTTGMQGDKTAYHLHNRERKLVIPPKTYHKTVELLRRSPDFTLSAIIRQENLTSGPIISFSNDNNVYLELQSSGRRSEIRFHYTYIALNGKPQTHMESFAEHLADEEWHKISLSVSSREIQLYIDCRPIYRRVTHYIPDRNFSASNLQLFVGQRTINGHSLFKGDLQDVRIIPGPYGYLAQCPTQDSYCPTCGQFSILQNTIEELRHTLTQLTQRLVAAENRVSRLEECDCKKSCIINGTRKEDGERWSMGCDECKCEHGVISCALPCKPTNCTYPEKLEGECCPKCLKECRLYQQDFEHGQIEVFGCRKCTCQDGSMTCKNQTCSTLSCPPEQQVSIPNECCKFCPGDDYCAKGHACHANATCINLNTKYTCTCRPGFQGDGFHCSDIDECAQQGGLIGNHCHLNTKCVNTSGSYICECLPGFRRVDTFNCADINECAMEQHVCHNNGICINTPGSYRCRCNLGYEGDGINCKPICNQTCLNGGQCLSPNVCTCRMGFIGSSCEQDLDECASGLHTCKSTATCVNMPGFYYCKCKPGYEIRGTDCIDIDECLHNTHTCHNSAHCINTDGHFSCECPIEHGLECRLSCSFEGADVPDGQMVSPANQPCKICRCNKGVILCEDRPCNCSTWRRGTGRDLCCPQCDPKESCQHQELKHVVFRSGEKWIYRCQTCECLYGEFDCWKLECPPLTCDKPLPLEPGDCCQRCEDDPCGLFPNSSFTSGKPCHYKGHNYLSGQSFSDSSNECTTCACKDGRLCCSFDNNCINNQRESFTKNPSILSTRNIDNNYKSSETTTPAGNNWNSLYQKKRLFTTTRTTTILSKMSSYSIPENNKYSAPATPSITTSTARTTTEFLSKTTEAAISIAPVSGHKRGKRFSYYRKNGDY